MPDNTAFGYEYLLTIGRPEQLIKTAVPYNNTPAPHPVFLATAAIPSGIANMTGDILNSDRLEGILGPEVSTEQIDYRTIPNRSIDIFDKQLEVDIDNEKDNNSPCVIRVYNLTRSEGNLIKENSSIILKAGYRSQLPADNFNREDLPLLYIGEVIRVHTEDDGEDFVTEIVCAEGRTPLRNIKISMSWTPGTTYQDMIFDLIDICAGAGIPLGRFEGDNRQYNLQEEENDGAIGLTDTDVKDILGIDTTPEPDTIINDPAPNGYQVAGLLGKELEKLAENVGYRAYMCLGKLYVEPKYSNQVVEVINLTGNNIIGRVHREEDGSKGLSGDQLDRAGIKFKTFLNGNITANKYVNLSKLSNPEYEGNYKISAIKILLDYEGDAWHTEISATRIK